MSDPYALRGVTTRLWKLVALARHRLLMLDYDGTLAPFTVARHEARPLPRSRELLERIGASPHTDLAIVSGRPLTELESLAGDLSATLVGEHGWERRALDGVHVKAPLANSVSEILDRSARVVDAFVPPGLLERKRTAVVLHTRSLPRDQAEPLAARCEDAWRDLVGTEPLVIDRIDGGIELRARGRDKGTAVLSLMSQSPPGTLGVLLADDVTDEDGFEVVRDWGFGVRVSRVPRPSLAMASIAGWEEVPAFLERWIEICETTATHATRVRRP